MYQKYPSRGCFYHTIFCLKIYLRGVKRLNEKKFVQNHPLTDTFSAGGLYFLIFYFFQCTQTNLTRKNLYYSQLFFFFMYQFTATYDNGGIIKKQPTLSHLPDTRPFLAAPHQRGSGAISPFKCVLHTISINIKITCFTFSRYFRFQSISPKPPPK